MKRLMMIVFCAMLITCHAQAGNPVVLKGEGASNGKELPYIDVFYENDLLHIRSVSQVSQLSINIMNATGDVIYSDIISVTPNACVMLPNAVADEMYMVEVVFDGMVLRGYLENQQMQKY